MRSLAQNAPLWLAVAVMALGMWGCQDTPKGGGQATATPPPDTSGKQGVKLTDHLTLGTAIVVENVTVWPVYSNAPVPADQGDYITLAHAQEIKAAQVRETGAAPEAQANNNAPAQEGEVRSVQPQLNTTQAQQVAQNNLQAQQLSQGEVSGQVNQLVIENKGTRPILVLAGTLVKGGKQDRQIAQDFIIPPGKTVPVDAFCVEQGRWTAQRDGQATQGVFQAQKYLAVKEVRDSGQFKGSQREVWAKVADTNAGAGNVTTTGTLFATIDEDDKEALARRDRIRKGIEEGLGKTPSAPVGLAYAVDGEVREIRAFNDPRILKHYREPLLNTIAVEADLGQRKAKKEGKAVFSGSVDTNEVLTVVQQAEKNAEEAAKTKAGNYNAYKKGADFSSSQNFASEEDRKANKQPVSQSWMKH